MKNGVLLFICCLLLLSYSSCVTTKAKCPQFNAKRSSPGVHYTASRHVRSKPKAQAAPVQAKMPEDIGLDPIAVGGIASSGSGLELKIPKMFSKKMSDNEIEETDHLFKSESDNRVMLVKKGNKLFLKAKEASDIPKLMTRLTTKREHAPGGGGTGSLALASGILGIIAFVLAFGPYAGFLSFLLGLLAVIFGIIGLSSGRVGWAIIGIIFGILALALAGVFVGIVYVHFL